MTAYTLNPIEGERMDPRTETPYTLNLAFATKEERIRARHLIAAASELLSVLEKLVAECSAFSVEAIREGTGNMNAAVFALCAQEARAAIAKAKGE